jgi:hypothetical protein
MTIPHKQLPSLWSPPTILCDEEDDEKLARALENEDKWVNGFIKRLNLAVEDITRKK